MNNLITSKCALSIFCLFSIFALVTCDDSASNRIISSWVQMGPGGTVIARIVTNRNNCPKIVMNGEGVKMNVRHEPDNDFPVLVCEALIPPGTRKASVLGRFLTLPVENPQRIVLLGDTGCRLETGDPPQSCNDPQEWPFKQISDQAASFKPDLVIHVGDYLYREDACPQGDTGCEGSPFGDNLDTWKADFLTPARRLLREVPWVFTRGNHEECGRAGKGWFILLDPNTPFEKCEKFTPPYVVDIGSLDLLMLDSSAAKDNSAPADDVAVYRSQINTLEASSGDNAWMVTHHPFWGIGESSGELFMINDTLMAASDNTLDSKINLVLSGHIHFFELLNFVGDRQPQLIIGMSGTEVDSLVETPFPGLEIGGGTVNQGFNLNQFGFALLELVDGVWEMSIIDVDGNEILACEIDGREATCFP